MKIYLASSWRNDKQPGAVLALRNAGHEVYDFRNPEPGNLGFHWSAIDPGWKAWSTGQFRGHLDHIIAERWFSLDFDAMKWADAGVLLLPCGRSAHLEAGFFVGAGKPLHIVLSPDGFEPELMYKMAMAIHLSITDLIPAL